GRGITGGRIIDYGAHATRAAEMGLRVLAGEKPEGIIAGDVPNPPMFDARQLSRWMISEKRLPAGSIVQFEEPSRWESYRPVILILIVCLLEALLILALLIYRQRRRKAEERLRENEERLRLAMSAAALDVWSWDIPRDRIRLSQQVGKMLPETPTAEVTYKDFLALVHPEDRERVDAAIQRAIRTEKEYECDFRLAHRDGTMQWISSRGSCSYNRPGPLRMNGVSQDITERKRAELALRESEQRFRKMTDAAHMMVWMSGPDKGCIFFNQSWLNFTGRRLEQEVGDGWTEGVHPEDVERIIREYSRAFDAWEPFELEYRLRHFDGEYRWIVDVGTPLYEEDGRFCGYLGSCLDITERKRADEGRQLLAAVVESSDDAILSFDLDTRVTSWNPGAERLFGFAEAEVKGKPAWFHVPPESREQTMRALERIKAGQATSWEGVRCRKDGALIEVSISSAPIRNTVGEIVGGTTTLRDITPRKRAERELRESEERFRTLFEESPLAIGVSREGRVLYTNKTYLEMFGYGSVEELRGQTVREQWAPECHEALAKRTLRRELGLPLPAEFEGLGLRKDGSQFPVHAFATRAQLADGMANIAFLTDVTERKRAEGEVDRLRRELAHMSRVTMMGELTASLAHELNQPLTAIVSNAHAGERYLAGPTPPLEELRAILADVSADAQRAGEVIRRLRGLLKKDTTRFLPLDLNELIREVVALTQTDALIRHQPIALTLAPDLPPIRGDRVQLQQVLLNLVLNGMEAMEPLPATARQLSLQTLPAGTAVRVAVQDRGPGIPSDKRETIFDAFVTTKTQGLGMGLAISRSIVEAHGGRIWVENNPERGATFWFSLPV
ncbi:MAG TPA: PAS domain S-box protein, partial [Candidatus Methylomirabilis sp.]|nr:PAS domain S-box protein [Candidatus Methylomirabilis sp.]